MKIWRIVKAHYTNQAYTGMGSDRSPGRWHEPPWSMVYASASASLAILEKLVWVHRLERLAPYVLVPADVPEGLVQAAKDLPADWNAVPHRATSRAHGTKWLTSRKTLALRVPSALSPEDNILLNPMHPDMRHVAPGDPIPIREALTPRRSNR